MFEFCYCDLKHSILVAKSRKGFWNWCTFFDAQTYFVSVWILMETLDNSIHLWNYLQIITYITDSFMHSIINYSLGPGDGIYTLKSNLSFFHHWKLHYQNSKPWRNFWVHTFTTIILCLSTCTYGRRSINCPAWSFEVNDGNISPIPSKANICTHFWHDLHINHFAVCVAERLQ